jgi:antirestriction protein ArdC
MGREEITMQTTTKKLNPKDARALSAHVARMTPEEREALSEKLSTVINPQGHALTVHNTIFLFMQCERTDLTIVAGFKQWINAGRVVRKGEHSIGFISVPMQLKTGKQDKDGNDERATRFRLVAVFDVSQTDELEDDDS